MVYRYSVNITTSHIKFLALFLFVTSEALVMPRVNAFVFH